jgi:FtsP/CotA-like multicopper oxidase with cupredoxin domain
MAFGLVLLSLVSSGPLAGWSGGPSARFEAPVSPPSFPLDACGVSLPWHYVDVVALRVPVSYNHWGDVDPNGRVFALAQDVPALLTQVAAALERAGVGPRDDLVSDPAGALEERIGTLRPLDEPLDVSPLVRPLVVRAHLGDCVQFNLTNGLPEPASLHVEGVSAAPGTAQAVGQNLPDLAAPGETRAYRYRIPDLPGMEGAHFLRSGADPRYQTKHGLFGALVAEPRGASWLAPDGSPADSGPEAIIVRPGASDFREYVVLYHDEVELVDRDLKPLPLIDPYFAYGPGTKAINLRSEPFMHRFDLHNDLFDAGAVGHAFDKSQAYGSYTYGDPATFMPRAYVGDPAKFRLVNAGPGTPHVHHLHGGGDRWRLSPLVGDTQFDDGLLKDNPIPLSPSQRVDVQVMGPGESYNAEIEGGAGGTQQSVGDFLYHCHVVEHYLAGMWSFWRVHNTRQPGLAELPDRAGRTPAGVDSTGLLGRTMPDGTVLDEATLPSWVESRLPPRGVPGDDDASVWDWQVHETPAGPLYVGEPETAIRWPNYASAAPGERPALLFNPVDGRLSYPFLRPHFGERPPFAPAHGPAPHLGPEAGHGHEDGLCPRGARRLEYHVVALSTPVAYNTHGDRDANGQVFVLAEDKANVSSGAKPAKNLVLRANQGDCVDLLLTSQLQEAAFGPSHSKVNMHIHLVQFDVQASDGVITGLNYEQSVRPAAATGTSLAATAAAGDEWIRVDGPGALRVGTEVGVGLTEPSVEVRTIVAVDGALVRLDRALASPHASGERVGPEFVRYRWYADVELGTVYWHDHVDGLNSWRHGLFGALVVEPRGSRWLDPRRDPAAPDERREIREGTMADIVPPGPKAAFREYVAEIQDRTFCLPRPQSCEDQDDLISPLSPQRLLAGFNLRSEPFRERNLTHPLLSAVGNRTRPDVPQGDPATDLWQAYAGDPVIVRLLYGGQASTRAVNTFAVAGHRFPYEPDHPGSRLTDAITLGISSQHTLKLECGAGGCARTPGDYLYHMTSPDLFWRGAWGVFRVHGERQDGLWPLPGQGRIERAVVAHGPVRHYDVVALEADVAYNEKSGIHAPTKLFALASEADAIQDGSLRPLPLVIRAVEGDLVEIALTNRLTEPVSLHTALLSPAPGQGTELPVGRNADPSVPPGATRTYRVGADRAVGAARLSSLGGDAANSTLRGLYGALVVEPAGSAFAPATGMSADLTLADGTSAREHVLLYASQDAKFESGIMPYTVDVVGLTSVNYRTEPLWERVGGRVQKPNGEFVGGLGTHPCQFDTNSCTVAGMHPPMEVRNPLNPWARSLGDPETPLLGARPGQAVVVRALGASGDQTQTPFVEGQWWKADPRSTGSNLVPVQLVGPGEQASAWIGDVGPSGDRVWGTHRDAFAEGGAWGLLRVG